MNTKGFTVRLPGAGAALSVFLFGQAHQDHRGLTEGCLVALMNPKVKVGDKSPMVSISGEEGLIKLGTAADFGRCKSRRQVFPLFRVYYTSACPNTDLCFSMCGQSVSVQAMDLPLARTLM